jgi:hypothetical protein
MWGAGAYLVSNICNVHVVQVVQTIDKTGRTTVRRDQSSLVTRYVTAAVVNGK